MFGIGRQSRTRQSRTSWAGIAAQPGAAAAAADPGAESDGNHGLGNPEHPGRRLPNILGRRRGYAGRGGRRDCRCSESDGNHGLGNPEHPGRRLPNILGGGAAMPGAAAGLPMFGIGRQSRTRQSRTSWAAVANILLLCRARRRDCRCSESDGNHGLGNPEHPGAAAQPAMNILGGGGGDAGRGGGIADVRNRTAITDSAIPNILGRHSSATRGGGRGGGSRGGIGRQSRTRQSRTSWAGIAAQSRGGGCRTRTSWAGIAAATRDSAIPNILGRRLPNILGRRRCYAGRGGGIADVRNRTAITDSAIPNILGRHSSATRGGNRTRQSRTSWAAVAEHPGRRRGYAGRGGGIADVRNRTAITDSAIPNILGGGCRTSWAAAPAMPGAAAGLPMFGIGCGNHGLGNPEHPGPA